MPATIQQLVTVRSKLAEEVRDYLRTVAGEAAALDQEMCPEHLRDRKNAFRRLRQDIEVARFGDPLSHGIAWGTTAGETYGRAILVGGPGSGKTWLLRYEARRTAVLALRRWRRQDVMLGDLVLPLRVDLPAVASRGRYFFDAVVDQAAEGRSERFRCYLAEQIGEGRCRILIDGLTELRRPTTWAWRIQSAFRGPCRKCGAMLALRTPDYRFLARFLNPLGADAAVLRLLAFREEAYKAFVNVWFRQKEAGEFLGRLDSYLNREGMSRITPLALREKCRKDDVTVVPVPPRGRHVRTWAGIPPLAWGAAGVAVLLSAALWLARPGSDGNVPEGPGNGVPPGRVPPAEEPRPTLLPTIRVTDPVNGAEVPHSCAVRGWCSNLTSRVTLVVHPVSSGRNGQYWEHRVSNPSNGWWEANTTFGVEGEDAAGQAFRVRAIADPAQAPAHGEDVGRWLDGRSYFEIGVTRGR